MIISCKSKVTKHFNPIYHKVDLDLVNRSKNLGLIFNSFKPLITEH